MSRKKLRLYVWEEFRCDYTCGLAFAIASSEEEAQKLVEDCYGFEFYKDFWVNNPAKIHELNEKVGYGVSGGG